METVQQLTLGALLLVAFGAGIGAGAEVEVERRSIYQIDALIAKMICDALREATQSGAFAEGIHGYYAAPILSHDRSGALHIFHGEMMVCDAQRDLDVLVHRKPRTLLETMACQQRERGQPHVEQTAPVDCAFDASSKQMQATRSDGSTLVCGIQQPAGKAAAKGVRTAADAEQSCASVDAFLRPRGQLEDDASFQVCSAPPARQRQPCPPRTAIAHGQRHPSAHHNDALRAATLTGLTTAATAATTTGEQLPC